MYKEVVYGSLKSLKVSSGLNQQKMGLNLHKSSDCGLVGHLRIFGTTGVGVCLLF